MENNNNLPSTISGDGRKFISLLKNYLTDISDVVNDIYTVLGTDESTVIEIEEYIKNVIITEKNVGGNVTLEISWNKDDIVQYAGVDILVKEKTEYYTGNWEETEVTRTYKTGKVTQFTLENISVGHSYQITVLGRNMKGATSKADSSPAVEYYVSPNDHTPLMPYDFTVVFDKRGAYWSWKQRDNSGTQWTELRLDENAGIEYNRLEITTGLYSTAIPTVRAGKAYLYNKGIGNAYTTPAIVNYNKAVPPAPNNIIVSKFYEGLTITFDSIPEDCNGANIYINNEVHHVTSNVFTFNCSTGDYTIKVCYTDVFGEGEMSLPVSESTVEEIPIEMLNKEKLGINAINQGITDINNARKEADKKIGGLQTSLTAMNGIIDAKVQDAKDTAESRLTATANAINSTVSDNFNNLQTSITQVANSIEVKVEAGVDKLTGQEIVSRINLAPDTVSISGKYIHITGETVFDDGVIIAKHIGDKAVVGTKIADGAITTDKLSANAVTAWKISANAVTAGTIAAGAVTTETMNADSINGDRIITDTLDASKIKANTITASQIASNTITADNLLSDNIEMTGNLQVSGGGVTLSERGLSLSQSNGSSTLYNTDGINYYDSSGNIYAQTTKTMIGVAKDGQYVTFKTPWETNPNVIVIPTTFLTNDKNYTSSNTRIICNASEVSNNGFRVNNYLQLDGGSTNYSSINKSFTPSALTGVHYFNQYERTDGIYRIHLGLYQDFVLTNIPSTANSLVIGYNVAEDHGGYDGRYTYMLGYKYANSGRAKGEGLYWQVWFNINGRGASVKMSPVSNGQVSLPVTGGGNLMARIEIYGNLSIFEDGPFSTINNLEAQNTIFNNLASQVKIRPQLTVPWVQYTATTSKIAGGDATFLVTDGGSSLYTVS